MASDKTSDKKGGSASSKVVSMNPDMDVDFSNPNKAFVHNMAEAYDGWDTNTETPIIVYLAPPHLLPRLDRIMNYRYAAHTNLLHYKGVGFVRHPDTGKEYAALAYEQPDFQPVLKTWGGTFPEMSHRQILEDFLKPLLSALQKFKDQDFTHGAVNLRNIFRPDQDATSSDSEAEQGQDAQVLLGECLSAAATLQNHVLYETVDRAMADSFAKGTGTLKDDLYALGVCVAMLAWQYNPCREMKDEEILAAKIENGTFGMLAQPEKVSGDLLEFLRGVLNDDENERWGFEDIEMWLSGQRLSPRQPAIFKKASRPVKFEGQEYLYLKNLIMCLQKTPAKTAAKFLKGGTFLKWFMNCFSDKNLLGNLETVLEVNKAPLKTDKDMEIFKTQMLSAINPEGPSSYNSHQISVRGFGHALGYQIAHQREINDFVSYINLQLYAIWLNMQINVPTDAAVIAGKFEQAKNFVNKKIPGMGIERVLYTFCESAPCLSPLFQDDFVYSPAQLLAALDRLAAKGKLELPMFDRHMTAFLSVRKPRYIEKHISLITSNAKDSQTLGALKVSATIQKSENAAPAISLGDYFIDRAPEMLDQLHNSQLREKLLKEIEKMRGTGNIAGILMLVSDDKIVAADAKKFRDAQQSFQGLEARKQDISGSMERKKKYGYHKGRQVAMLLAAILSSLTIMFNIVSFFIG